MKASERRRALATRKDPFNERDHQAAIRRGNAKAKLPTALVADSLDKKARTVRLCFRAGLELAVPIKAIPELANVPISKLNDVKASPLSDRPVFSEYDEAF